MTKYYYTKKTVFQKKSLLRICAILLFLCGFGILIYVLFPLISWQLYFQPQFTSATLASPVPRNSLVTKESIQELIASAQKFQVDYTNAQNWYPNLHIKTNDPAQIPSYTLSIPAINIKDAIVSTTDYDLSKHLVNYGGTAIPPENGASIVFGHSTLPQLFNPKDYKTIFANAYKLKTGDSITANVDGVAYVYKIVDIIVVDPDDTSMFSQNYDNSYLTLITCTPPGTTWKRLVVKARLEKI